MITEGSFFRIYLTHFFFFLFQVDPVDRANFTKVVETINTNFNERFEEIRKHWGGGLLGAKSMARINKIEKAKSRELAQKQSV